MSLLVLTRLNCPSGINKARDCLVVYSVRCSRGLAWVPSSGFANTRETDHLRKQLVDLAPLTNPTEYSVRPPEKKVKQVPSALRNISPFNILLHKSTTSWYEYGGSRAVACLRLVLLFSCSVCTYS